MKLPEEQNLKIAIIGVSYVGLPLAINFAKYFAERTKLNSDCNFNIICFDKNQNRIQELKTRALTVLTKSRKKS